ncbi:uncharacterized protein EHS24_007041 [Apiotrichum porosum]|uniref:Protein CPL1-like domain-containing protein n=1 Tax=Apiotrichum porosum TaxID=105984 RepID=A0A427XX06_9TREE|nr:uncharacterized protein EHS24_007041 [Apiotrichum porosum]RSH83362.1 hypothetical protein EHS24_007041 [Apiotrichum porosum]
MVLLGLLLGLLFTNYASAVYVMCLDETAVQPGTIIDLDATPEANSPSGCAIACRIGDYIFSQYADDATVPGGACICLAADPGVAWTPYQAPPAAVIPSNPSKCPTGTYTVQYIDANYKIKSCYDNITFSDVTSQTPVDGISDCFDVCTNSGAQYIALNIFSPLSKPQPFCICGAGSADQVITLGKQTACGQSSYNFARRQLGIKGRRLKTRTVDLCPTGMQACAIAGSDGYECIDPMDELESCGGCVDGYYPNSNAKSGIDCTTIQGVAPGGVSCNGGQCIVSRCLASHQLVSEQCVPIPATALGSDSKQKAFK